MIDALIDDRTFRSRAIAFMVEFWQQSNFVKKFNL